MPQATRRHSPVQSNLPQESCSTYRGTSARSHQRSQQCSAKQLPTQRQLLPYLCASSRTQILRPHPERCHSSFPGSSSKGYLFQEALAPSTGLTSTFSSHFWGPSGSLSESPPAFFLLPWEPQVLRLPVPGMMSSHTCRAQDASNKSARKKHHLSVLGLRGMP